MQLAEHTASPAPQMLPNWQEVAVASVAGVGAPKAGRTRRDASARARAENCIVKSGGVVKVSV